jgi:hypothetical protein
MTIQVRLKTRAEDNRENGRIEMEEYGNELHNVGKSPQRRGKDLLFHVSDICFK